MLRRNSVLAAVLCATAFPAACFAQSYTTYGVVTSKSNPGTYGGNTYTADLNNDGIPDLIVNEYTNYAHIQPVFAVFIADGDGTFQAPVQYQYPPGIISPDSTGPGPVPMAFGDFNGDGNVDIAMPAGNLTIAVYLGRGDGIFVNPWYSVIDLPSTQYILAYNPVVVAADFNHDGKLDLAVVGGDQTGNTVYILPGQGNGLFSAAVPILAVPNPGGGGQWGVEQVQTGDFDGDTNADVAVEASEGNSVGGAGTTTVHVLYGDGNFGFTDTIPITTYGAPPLSAGDLNSDGKSDLLTFFGDILLTSYGQGDRTFASYSQTLPAAGYGASATAIADFNDDGLNDIAVSAGSFLVFLLATPSPGQFDIQTWNTPTSPGVPVVGDFNHDGKPDWAYIGVTGPYTGGTSTAYAGLNATVGQLWSNCDYPAAGRGINLCSPAISSGSTVSFNATAHSFGDLRKMELWVDGTKLGEQYNTWEGNGYFNLSSTLSPGTHSGTYYAADFDNSLQRYDFNFTVPSSCSAPSLPGVNICAPATGSSISSQSVLMKASANITGTLARMEIWVDSVKKYTETNSPSLSAAVMASPGTHQFTVYAVNTDDMVWSQTATATIQ